MVSGNHDGGYFLIFKLSFILLGAFYWSCSVSPIIKDDGAAEMERAIRPDSEKYPVLIDSERAGIQGSRKSISSLESQGKTAGSPTSQKFEPGDSSLPNEKIYMDMKDVDLKILLRTLARIANLSVIISENVKGVATINIHNEPWDQVFISILKTYGLRHEWEGNIVRIITIDDIGYDYKHLELDEKLETKRREMESVAPLVKDMIEINFADAESIRKIFEQLLTEHKGVKRGSVAVEPHTNALIIHASQKDIDEMKRLVVQLDRPTPQIRIEAQIVEATHDTARELGVEWGGILAGSMGDSDFWVTPGIDSSTSNATNESSSSSLGDIGTTIPTYGLIQKLPSVLNEDSGILVGLIAREAGKYLLGVQLSALERQGKLQILSSPAITTLDNQTALIESGREVPFQTVVDDDVNIEFKKAVLSLVVTPHVIFGDMLKLKIVTFKDELDFTNAVKGNPTIITKKAETTVILNNGQTTVIGGLRKEDISQTDLGVPVLKDLPLLGTLFKRDSNKDTKEEILIFITPRIINHDPLVRRSEMRDGFDYSGPE